MNSPMRKMGISALMVLMLLIGTLQGTQGSTDLRLSSNKLSGLYGGSDFWKDPCTLDGFLFGLSASGCMMGNLFGCIGAAGALVKAWKADDCF